MESKAQLPSGAMMLVRPARASDAPSVLELHRSVLAEERYFITRGDEFSTTLEQQVRQLLDFGKSPNSLWLLGLLKGRVVGFVTIRGGALKRMRHVGRLEIMVSPDVRGQGIGRVLMERALAWSQSNAMLCKLSLAVFADNERAVAMYKGFGFEQEGYRSREYRFEDGSFSDDVLMTRWVEEGEH